jgi:ribonuclease D
MYTYIKNTNQLKELCKEIKHVADIIALDTEFLRQTTYFPKLCLIQICFFNKKIYKTALIDVLAEELELKPFISILQSKKIKKIIHCPGQDIEAFYHITKKVPRAIEDTQLMAEFCGYRHYMGYANSIQIICNVNFLKSKKTQKSNWGRRPLAKKQLEYASNDVKYLIEIYKILKKKLEENNNLKFYNKEIEQRYNKKLISQTIEDSWKRLRFKLDGKSLLHVTIVRNLCRWREKIAMKRNDLRKHILSDSAIKNIAKEIPLDKTALEEILERNEEAWLLSKADIKAILKCVKQGQKSYNAYKKHAEKEENFRYEIKGRKNKILYNRIVNFIKNKCEKNKITQELAINKANLVGVMTGFEKFQDVFYSWKYEIFGKEIQEILKNK